MMLLLVWCLVWWFFAHGMFHEHTRDVPFDPGTHLMISFAPIWLPLAVAWTLGEKFNRWN